jgi:hypothetical protein
VTADDGAFSCGGWTARLAASHGQEPGRSQPESSQPESSQPESGQPGLDLDGGGAAIDGLRALCAAAWSAGSVTAEMAEAVLGKLDFPS